MKTNQLMTIAFKKGNINFLHKTSLGDLTALFKIGLKYRIEKGFSSVNMTTFLNSAKTQDFIEIIARNQNIPKDKVIQHNGKRGKASRTFANLHFIIYTAEYLDPDFHYEVIDTFIKNRILDKRDDGGDDFIELNGYLNDLTDRKDKKNSGIFIQVAMKLRSKIFTEHQILDCKTKGINIWNSEYATHTHLHKRDDYERKLISFIEMDFIDSYSGVKKAIDKLK